MKKRKVKFVISLIFLVVFILISTVILIVFIITEQPSKHYLVFLPMAIATIGGIIMNTLLPPLKTGKGQRKNYKKYLDEDTNTISDANNSDATF